MSDTVQQIKDRLSIQDVVAPYVKLSRAGRSMVGLCPFHKEKTPSFHVSIERGTWHCFGCGQGGDIFSFIEKIEGVEFKEALKILAEKAGVKITAYHGDSGREKSKKDRLREIMSRASEWYANSFAGSQAESYAKNRGISEETIRSWRLGYAPDSWRALLETLSLEGFTVQELLAAGLVKEADGKPGTYYDRFRNRLIFPIRDTSGWVVAFTGRALSSDDQAKYLNSPETDLYHKSEILFGMDKAKDVVRVRNFTMLVEGQMDVLLVHQIGFGNAVALSGTALSEKHLALMKRYSENLMLVLDADSAGLSATAKSAELALRQGLRVKAVRLPLGKDPADIVKNDQEKSGKEGNEFSKYVAAAKPISEFFLASLCELEHDAHRLVTLVEKIVLPLIAVMKSPMERDHAVQNTARSLGLSPEAVRESLQKLLKQSSAAGSTVNMRNEDSIAKRSPKEKRIEQLLAIVHAYPNTALAEHIKKEYCRITGTNQLPSDPPSESAIFEAEKSLGEKPVQEAVGELLRAFEEIIVREEYQKAVMQLRKAEAARNKPAIKSAESACKRISARLAALN